MGMTDFCMLKVSCGCSGTISWGELLGKSLVLLLFSVYSRRCSWNILPTFLILRDNMGTLDVAYILSFPGSCLMLVGWQLSWPKSLLSRFVLLCESLDTTERLIFEFYLGIYISFHSHGFWWTTTFVLCAVHSYWRIGIACHNFKGLKDLAIWRRPGKKTIQRVESGCYHFFPLGRDFTTPFWKLNKRKDNFIR